MSRNVIPPDQKKKKRKKEMLFLKILLGMLFLILKQTHPCNLKFGNHINILFV